MANLKKASTAHQRQRSKIVNGPRGRNGANEGTMMIGNREVSWSFRPTGRRYEGCRSIGKDSRKGSTNPEVTVARFVMPTEKVKVLHTHYFPKPVLGNFVVKNPKALVEMLKVAATTYAKQ